MRHEQQLRLHAAQRARQRPDFLGWVLARFSADERISERTLKKQLGASEANWVPLQLCLRPRPQHFLSDVSAIAAECQVDRDALAAIIRRVEAIEVLRAIAPPAGDRPQPASALESQKPNKKTENLGSVLAARTRKKRQTNKKDSGRGGHGS